MYARMHIGKWSARVQLKRLDPLCPPKKSPCCSQIGRRFTIHGKDYFVRWIGTWAKYKDRPMECRPTKYTLTDVGSIDLVPLVPNLARR